MEKSQVLQNDVANRFLLFFKVAAKGLRISQRFLKKNT